MQMLIMLSVKILIKLLELVSNPFVFAYTIKFVRSPRDRDWAINANTEQLNTKPVYLMGYFEPRTVLFAEIPLGQFIGVFRRFFIASYTLSTTK